ncbi:unnamed protein product [Pseudo-nitzschia multistriata]|uniref:Protein phosphatase n=1 Tax=Pseudo-nitzschia multistriata TaxID=183589 RepID=A0A448ZGJ5_9STRA|nr:unnamed protein product [Pseudo-nitzschia multistriata]
MTPTTAAPSKPVAAGRLRSFCLLLALLLLSAAGVRASAPVPDEAPLAGAATDANAKSATARFVHKTIIIPHDDKKFRGGEDAASTVDDLLVVADGVGGWANRGVNPGLYSRRLTELITTRFSALSPDEKAGVNMRRLLHAANHEAASEHLGSATCTVVRLLDAETLQTLNVGDSTYSIHRRKTGSSGLEVVYAAEPGQKGFNFPYQLGGDYGDQVDDPGACDGPRTHALEDKDVIVVVSDGVNDNMDPEEYHACIEAYQWKGESSKGKPSDLGLEDLDVLSFSAVADCIARKAYALGKDRNHYSPFARSAATYGKRYRGGKHDDITVTVAQVEPVGRTPPSQKDPHRSESIFLYRDEDGPVGAPGDLPSMEDLLEAMGEPALEAEL